MIIPHITPLYRWLLLLFNVPISRIFHFSEEDFLSQPLSPAKMFQLDKDKVKRKRFTIQQPVYRPDGSSSPFL